MVMDGASPCRAWTPSAHRPVYAELSVAYEPSAAAADADVVEGYPEEPVCYVRRPFWLPKARHEGPAEVGRSSGGLRAQTAQSAVLVARRNVAAFRVRSSVLLLASRSVTTVVI